ncbi:GGDEF domain-containing protein [Shewanella sp.]|nr:GGDEF domain-containing protein [Shewanella sp.]
MNAHSSENNPLPSFVGSSSISAKRYAALLAMIVSDAPLTEVLHAIVQLIEDKNSGCKGSVLLLSSDGKRLLKGAAPSIPDEYNNVLHNTLIGPNVGSCGAAAFTGKRVIVEDISTHRNWAVCSEFALSFGLRSCWSEPIFSANGAVLGTFAMYYAEVKSPCADDLKLINEAALLISLAIERDRAARFQRLYSGIFTKMPLAFLVTDAKGAVMGANPSLLKIMRTTSSHLTQFIPSEVFSLSPKNDLNTLFHHLDKGQAWQGELVGRRVDDQIFNAGVNVTAFKEAGESEYSYAWIFSDITDRKLAVEMIHYQAKFDPLTGLINRTHLFEQVEQQLDLSKLNSDYVFTLIVMDLDNFKQINDNVGHKQGDEILVQVAQRMKSVMGEQDILGRLGGDEFALIIPGEARAEVIAAHVKKLNELISREYLLDSHHRAFTHLSAGIARYPQDASNLEQLLNCADQALFHAKERGRNQFHFFTAKMQSDAEKTATLNHDLKLAIENNAFELYYQPIVCAKQQNILYVEALVRWRHEGQLVRPDEFIAAAETSGLIIELGQWIRVEAMKTLLEFQTLGLTLGLSINISTFEFWSHDLQNCLVSSILNIAEDLCSDNYPYQQLTLEITESLLMKEQPHLINSFNKLRALGIKIAVDDFGTGYSSLSYLSQFPIDIIKIDKSFIQDVSSKKQTALVTAVVALSRALDLSVTVEGVESEQQLAFVNEKDIDCIQGYLFYKPMPKQELLELLTLNRT